LTFSLDQTQSMDFDSKEEFKQQKRRWVEIRGIEK